MSSLRESLQAIYDKHGKLTPSIFVDEARPPDHPEHGRFEWDDSIAGEAWRRQQAHEMIRSVTIEYRVPSAPDTPKQVRAWQAVRSEIGHVYEPTEKIVEDPLLTRIVLADMEREWRQLRDRYDRFEEFWQIVKQDIAAA